MIYNIKIETNRKQNALEATVRRHDRIALAERRRRNVITDLSFGSGCRCSYDTNDGGEYTALFDLRKYGLIDDNNNDVNNNNNNDDNDNQEKDKDVMKKNNDNDSNSDSDSEFDYLLDDDDLPGGQPINDNNETTISINPLKLLQQERLEELQLSALIRESALQHGFGVHRQFHPQRVLHAAGLGFEGKRYDANHYNRTSSGSSNVAALIPPAAVIHLNEDCVLSASLDLCLEEMALNTYRGTKFLRSFGRSTLSFNKELVQKVLPTLKIDSSLPALIAVKDGVVVSICENLSLFVNGGRSHQNSNKDEMVDSRAVEEWLDRTGVLLHEVPIAYEDYCRIRPEEDALIENMMREKARLTEEERFDCGVPGCEKTFYHEHVGVKNGEQSGLVVGEDLIS